jgi:hypothetical protein
MNFSKLSTKSVSKQYLTQKSNCKKDFVISGEFISGQPEKSLDLSSSFEDQESYNNNNILGNKELNLLADLAALDASVIPNDSRSVSIIKDLRLEEEKDDRGRDEKARKPRALILETSQIKQKWWVCHNCIIVEDNQKTTCCIA